MLKGHIQELLSVAAMTLPHRIDVYSRWATTMFLQLAQHLNRASGDDAIDLLKRQVVEQGAPLLLPLCQSCPLYAGMDADELLCFNAEAKIKAAWQAARRTKVADDEADINHTPAQHDVNEILQYK